MAAKQVLRKTRTVFVGGSRCRRIPVASTHDVAPAHVKTCPFTSALVTPETTTAGP